MVELSHALRVRRDTLPFREDPVESGIRGVVVGANSKSNLSRNAAISLFQLTQTLERESTSPPANS